MPTQTGSELGDFIRSRQLSEFVATNTLAQGVNLPMSETPLRAAPAPALGAQTAEVIQKTGGT